MAEQILLPKQKDISSNTSREEEQERQQEKNQTRLEKYAKKLEKDKYLQNYLNFASEEPFMVIGGKAEAIVEAGGFFKVPKE